MAKYLFKRILHGIVSIVIVVAIIMIMIYSMMDRTSIFAKDSAYSHQKNNARIVYMNSKWEEYGYIKYVSYNEYLKHLVKTGELSEDDMEAAANIGKTEQDDSKFVREYVNSFKDYYEDQGYEVVRLEAVMTRSKKYADGGQQQLFAYKDVPLINRLASYLHNLVTIDNVNNVENIEGERGISFTLYDPAYGGNKFSPAIIGNGTKHKYLLYFDNSFPYVHQNVINISLGKSYSVNKGIDVFDTMNMSQGSYTKSMITYPTGLEMMSADDLHTATYAKNSLKVSKVLQTKFTDDYTNVTTVKTCKSKIGYSFIIGIISTLLAYILGVPLGIMMARKKDKLADKIGTIYIVFILAVPSLAYIFLFKAIGGKAGLPTVFNMEKVRTAMYILPIVSLMLPSVANLMKWLRRYMIDQMNSDYVKFARSGGLTDREIFFKHILKNAAIPIIHDIPAAILFAMVGALITERVYSVPGAGNLLIDAIGKYDNGVIVGVSLFYAILEVVSLILGDVLISMADPRISFSTKDR